MSDFSLKEFQTHNPQPWTLAPDNQHILNGYNIWIPQDQLAAYVRYLEGKICTTLHGNPDWGNILLMYPAYVIDAAKRQEQTTVEVSTDG